MLIIGQAKWQDAEKIQFFYHQCGYGGGVSEEDLISIAQFNGRLVGAVRLCPDTGFFVLRGMQVLAPFQRQKIGTQLLQFCVKQLDYQGCYCIPWQHLKSFYQQVEFQEISSPEAPDIVHKRFSSYVSKGMNVILMYRSGN